MVRRITATTRLRGHRPAAALAATVAAAGAVVILVAASSSSAASSETTAGSLQHQLTAGQQRVTQLAGTAASAGQRVHTLGSGIAALKHQLAGLQRDLSGRRTRLLTLRDQLEAADTKLGGLERTKAAAERLLAQQLVGSYEDQPPNIVNVVLESTGFNDLLDQLAFIQRINQQDARVTAHVRSARRAVAVEARSLGRLNARAQVVAEGALSERNQVARDRLRLVVRQLAAAKAQAAATGALASAQVQVPQLTEQLAKLPAA
jgi:peptidoglycan hydrolase CwlO-like protein